MRMAFPAVAPLTLGLAAILAAPAGGQTGFQTSIKPYAVPVGTDYTIAPLLSVGDRVPETSRPGLEYQMVGIPDGLGAHPNPDGTITLYMNHELTSTTPSESVPGVETNRGAFVSRLTLAADGSILSGERAYDFVYQENVFVGPAAETGNTTPAFGRFCSGSLVGPEQGFSTYIYFANEESSAPGTFSLLGGQAVAIIGNDAYALPKLGHFAWENTLAASFPGGRVVIVGMEDGPSSPDSQLWLYVGQKDPSPTATVLGRNGLDNGKLYVFVSDTPGMTSEVTFQSGSIAGHWTEIPGAEFLSEAQLEAAADAAGAFGFIRTEDGAFNKSSRRNFYFVTTGGSAGNMLGRLYHLRLPPGNPVGGASGGPTAGLTEKTVLRIVYNADQVIAAGKDTAISPDNIDTSDDYLMINEDGTSQTRPIMASKGRDGSIWRFAIRPNGSIEAATGARIASLDPPGRDGVAVGPGIWETSGVIDASGLGLFVGECWLTDVQAHGPTAAPAPLTVEDGQLVLMKRN